jgi:uncharacterized protein YacL
MLDQLRGRNLAHVGCTIGLTAGLILGLVFGFLVIVVLNSQSGLSWGTFVFFATVFGLGALGWVVGDRVSKRLWGQDTTTRE